ncbi:MAG: exo-alpha-sialidase, partial [Planctomycetales bacterium]|nr:exo-alpha-sialidase [Planctomycetales bacterium]
GPEVRTTNLGIKGAHIGIGNVRSGQKRVDVSHESARVLKNSYVKFRSPNFAGLESPPIAGCGTQTRKKFFGMLSPTFGPAGGLPSWLARRPGFRMSHVRRSFRMSSVVARYGRTIAVFAALACLLSRSAGAEESAVVQTSDAAWQKQAATDASQDRTTIIYDGITPNKMVCDTTLRELPDGSWVLFFLAGGDTEPSPKNYTAVSRSTDQGKTWSKAVAFDTTFPREGKTIGQGPTELMIHKGRLTLFFSTHSEHWRSDWRSWFMTSDDSGKTWSKPIAVPGRLQNRTFIRNHIVCRDGRLMVPFQHYIGPESEQDKEPLARKFTNPRNGVLISSDEGKTWTEHGNIRLTDNDQYFGWAENNLAELSDGRIAMIIRADRLGGVLYYAESKDGGKTWPEFAAKSDIPNPGSKATLYPLGGDVVAMLHNPNPKHRSPMALWISFDGLKTWPYRRVLQAESCDGPKGRMNYPDGFVTPDKQWLHFAFDDNRHRAVYYGAKLPPLQEGK